jgi:hypothetical protein
LLSLERYWPQSSNCSAKGGVGASHKVTSGGKAQKQEPYLTVGAQGNADKRYGDEGEDPSINQGNAGEDQDAAGIGSKWKAVGGH